LISVSDKTGLDELGPELRALGWKIISTGGTAAALREAGCEVLEVSRHTGFPEILGGRVKTLHPWIFAGILAAPNAEHHAELSELEIPNIDLVVVNLYPFRETVARDDVDRCGNDELGTVLLPDRLPHDLDAVDLFPASTTGHPSFELFWMHFNEARQDPAFKQPKELPVTKEPADRDREQALTLKPQPLIGFHHLEIGGERSAPHLLHVSVNSFLDPLADPPVTGPGKPEVIKELTK